MKKRVKRSRSSRKLVLAVIIVLVIVGAVFLINFIADKREVGLSPGEGGDVYSLTQQLISSSTTFFSVSISS